MSDHHESQRLGLDTPIERRDLLNSTLLAAGSLLLGSATPLQLLAERGLDRLRRRWRLCHFEWQHLESRYSRSPDPRPGIRFTVAFTLLIHAKQYDCVVVGGGISGLAAALLLQRKSAKSKTCLVLDNHPVFGGEAKRNEFQVDGRRLDRSSRVRRVLSLHWLTAFFPLFTIPSKSIGQSFATSNGPVPNRRCKLRLHRIRSAAERRVSFSVLVLVTPRAYG